MLEVGSSWSCESERDSLIRWAVSADCGLDAKANTVADLIVRDVGDGTETCCALLLGGVDMPSTSTYVSLDVFLCVGADCLGVVLVVFLKM